ncbi:MAG: prealbumin-like fold domain-containing protein [Eubacteriales bacterium]|nr:prealbumin-like fold domain-containing protein [Eubacteriales bacterium]
MDFPIIRNSLESGLIAVAYLTNNKDYTLTEMSSPYGYQALIDSVTIRVDDDNMVYVNGSAWEPENGYYTITQVDIPTAANMPTVTIRNNDAVLKAVKRDAYSGALMPGVKFALYKEAKDSVTGDPMPDYYPIRGYEDLETDENGVIPGITMRNSDTPDGLAPGTYYLREKETPPGYQPLGVDLVITLTPTGHVVLRAARRPEQAGSWTIEEITDGTAAVTTDARTGVIEISVNNTPKEAIRIKKLDMVTSETLRDAAFELFQIGQIGSDGRPKEGERPMISGRTDGNGILNLGGLEMDVDISYFLFETAPRRPTPRFPVPS